MQVLVCVFLPRTLRLTQDQKVDDMAQNQPDRGQRGLPGGSPRYSAFAIAKKAINYHQDWQRAWRDPEPKSEYDAVIIGGGGHGLATAYYLAAVHGIANTAVIEKGWIGGGNTGRNTTIIRSNYLCGCAAKSCRSRNNIQCTSRVKNGNRNNCWF